MASTTLKNIFLSASIPLQERDPLYFESADIIAIRDAVIALATVALPHYKLIWGGHPSITPLIYYVMQKLELNIQQHVTIYQTKHFEKKYPADNNKFENVIQTPDLFDEEASLYNMRREMFESNDFLAGVFIGGMDGVETEYSMFKEYHPKAILIPLASTGAAAKIIYDGLDRRNLRFLTDYAYMSLFQDFLINH